MDKEDVNNNLAKKNKSLSRIKNIILVASGKGGVGKSMVATNLALSLSKLGLDIGLLDADIYGPSIPIMFGIKDDNNIRIMPNSNKDNVIMLPIIKYSIKLMSIGFLISSSSPVIWRGPMLVSAFIQMMNQVLWGDLDYLIIDLPPGTGDIQLTISQKISVSGSIIVSTPQDLALADVLRAKLMFEKVNVRILGIIENMSFFICDKCNKKHEIFVRQSDKVYKNWNVELLGSIPLNSIISQTSDQGMPYVFQYENNISKIFCNLTKRLNQIINESVKKEIYKYKAYCKTEDKSKLPVI